MDEKNILVLKRNVNELTLQHNRLTLLCKMLYSNIKNINQELYAIKTHLNSNNSNSSNNVSTQQQSNNNSRQYNTSAISGNLNDLKADEILKQLSQNG